MAGTFKHFDLNNGVVADDPGAVITASKWDKSHRLDGGTHRQLVMRDTGEANTGMSLTSRPLAESIEFAAAPPTSPANRSFWIEDDGAGNAMLCYKTSTGTLVTINFG